MFAAAKCLPLHKVSRHMRNLYYRDGGAVAGLSYGGLEPCYLSSRNQTSSSESGNKVCSRFRVAYLSLFPKIFAIYIYSVILIFELYPHIYMIALIYAYV